jgi:hypothetical protein
MKTIVLTAALLFLPASGAAFAAEAKPAEAAGEKTRCKRIPETGSNVRAQKICRTEAEWRAIREGNKKNAEDLTNATGGMKSGS